MKDLIHTLKCPYTSPTQVKVAFGIKWLSGRRDIQHQNTLRLEYSPVLKPRDVRIQHKHRLNYYSWSCL
jgi:hypothetical protein